MLTLLLLSVWDRAGGRAELRLPLGSSENLHNQTLR